MPRLLDLFSGRWGWSRAFAARGWECIGVDLVKPPEIPKNCEFIQADILKVTDITPSKTRDNSISICHLEPDFIVASSPCEEFSVHGMKHFHPNPPFPYMGIELFNYARWICEESKIPYVMENVRTAQKFVGGAQNHCGSFYLWGNAVPVILPQGITKGFKHTEMYGRGARRTSRPHASATIPPELANCVADYAERLLAVNV